MTGYGSLRQQTGALARMRRKISVLAAEIGKKEADSAGDVPSGVLHGKTR